MSCSNSKNYARIKEVSIDTGLSRSQVSALFHQIKPAHKRGDAIGREKAFETARAKLPGAAQDFLKEQEERAKLLEEFSSVSIVGLSKSEVRELAEAYLKRPKSEWVSGSSSQWVGELALQRNRDRARFFDMTARRQLPPQHYLRQFPFQNWEQPNWSGSKLKVGTFNTGGEMLISTSVSAPGAGSNPNPSPDKQRLLTVRMGLVARDARYGGNEDNDDAISYLEDHFFTFSTYQDNNEFLEQIHIRGDALKLVFDNPGKLVQENRGDENFKWYSTVNSQTGDLTIYPSGSQSSSIFHLSGEEATYIQERLSLLPSALASGSASGILSASKSKTEEENSLLVREATATELPENCSECGNLAGSNSEECEDCEWTIEWRLRREREEEEDRYKYKGPTYDVYGRRVEYMPGGNLVLPGDYISGGSLVLPFENDFGHQSLRPGDFVVSKGQFVTVGSIESNAFRSIAWHLQERSDTFTPENTPVDIYLRVYNAYQPVQLAPPEAVSGMEATPYCLPLTDRDILLLAREYGCSQAQAQASSASSTLSEGDAPGNSDRANGGNSDTHKHKHKRESQERGQVGLTIGSHTNSMCAEVAWEQERGVFIRGVAQDYFKESYGASVEVEVEVEVEDDPSTTPAMSPSPSSSSQKAHSLSLLDPDTKPQYGCWLDWDTWNRLIAGAEECVSWKKGVVAGADYYTAASSLASTDA